VPIQHRVLHVEFLQKTFVNPSLYWNHSVRMPAG
jgi:hypothetical protein